MAAEPHNRSYLQARLREEVDRSRRYSHPFSLVVFEAVPSADGVPIRRKVESTLASIAACVRPSDVIARAFEDTIAVLLVETDASGAHDALFRIRGRLGVISGWNVTSLTYPRDADAIEALQLVSAA